MASERESVTEKVRRVLLREFVQARVTRAGFGGLDFQRTPMGTRVTLITERPGLVIGRRGEAIKSLTKAIEEDFKFNNPQIEVQELENPNLNAQIMAEKLANALERGWHFRRAGHSTVRRIMESGARGCQVVISGKLTGQRHRTEKFKDGHIKYCGQAKLDFMQNGFAVAQLKPGVTFAAGWTPCVGPILSSILLYASTAENMISGIFMLLAYSLDLGLPFFACSLALNTFLTTCQKARRYIGLFTKIGGVLLILVGVLLLTNSFEVLNDWLNRLLPS